MYLADSHTHSKTSHDASNTYSEMADSAILKGLSYVCFTDHVDECCTGFEETKWPYIPYREQINEAFESVRDEYRSRICLCQGIELGSFHHRPSIAQTISSYPELDFVIGSMHHLRNMPDFIRIKYTSADQCRELAAKYMTEAIEAVDAGCCDIFAHLGYFQRYMVLQGQGVDMLEFYDMFKILFTKLIGSGIGIEINTSGLRGPANTVFPLPKLVKLYHDLGGEIITVGSDAHNIKDIGEGIKNAYEVLKFAGFDYVTIFKKRKPEFIKLD